MERGLVIWFFGLPSSGKTTLADELHRNFSSKGILSKRLDGDILRDSLNSDLGFTEEDRKENIRRVAEVSKLFSEIGVITICSFITPKVEFRTLAKSIVGKDYFTDIYVDCSIETCIKRDVKGLYKKALNKEILNFTGIDSIFEIPHNPKFSVNTEQQTIEQSINNLCAFIKKHSVIDLD